MSKDAQQLEAARAVKDKAARVLGQFGLVSGVGITRKDGAYAVKVNLESEPQAAGELPKQIDGVPIVIRVVGRIRKQSD
ncbi:MAG: hypothetical protein O7D94_09930 [Planctomycetota bacterium]|nr:hypothetical protein [Planctomycetota bacterium]